MFKLKDILIASFTQSTNLKKLNIAFWFAIYCEIDLDSCFKQWKNKVSLVKLFLLVRCLWFVVTAFPKLKNNFFNLGLSYLTCWNSGKQLYIGCFSITEYIRVFAACVKPLHVSSKNKLSIIYTSPIIIDTDCRFCQAKTRYRLTTQTTRRVWILG